MARPVPIPTSGFGRWVFYAKAILRAGSPTVWRALGVCAGVGTVAVVLQLVHAGLAWALAEVVAGALCVVFAGGYLLWSAMERQIGALAIQPVQPRHADELRERLQTLVNAVTSDRPGSYGDPSDGRPLRREQFVAHFPDLVSQLDEWNAALEQRRVAPTRLREAFDRAIEERQLDRDLYDRSALAESLTQLTMARSLADQPEHSSELAWEGFADPDGSLSLGIRYGPGVGITVAHVPSRSESDRAMRAIEDLFADAQSWSETREVRGAHDALEAFGKIALRDNLATVQQRQEFRVAIDCPACGEAAFEGR